jgi:nucleoside-diphosphate-sugar epimerase
LRSEKILVAGAGGFIGGWVINNLLNQGYTDIRAVDIKPLSSWYQKFENVENQT